VTNLACAALFIAQLRAINVRVALDDFAAVVGMQTVAEFVQSEEVLKKLRSMGVDFAQDFFIHRPAPLDELLLGLPQPPKANSGLLTAA
jgi:EAL domain-containing protein (putative c-di-GMP-specific phosphodiesterase class I)